MSEQESQKGGEARAAEPKQERGALMMTLVTVAIIAVASAGCLSSSRLSSFSVMAIASLTVVASQSAVACFFCVLQKNLILLVVVVFNYGDVKFDSKF